MGIETGVHKRKGDALAREPRIGVKSKACRQNTEGRFCVQRPCRLNRLMESGVSLAKQRPQQILLNACWTPTIIASPEWVQSGLGKDVRGEQIPARRTLLKAAHSSRSTIAGTFVRCDWHDMVSFLTRFCYRALGSETFCNHRSLILMGSEYITK